MRLKLKYLSKFILLLATCAVKGIPAEISCDACDFSPTCEVFAGLFNFDFIQSSNNSVIAFLRTIWEIQLIAVGGYIPSSPNQSRPSEPQTTDVGASSNGLSDDATADLSQYDCASSDIFDCAINSSPSKTSKADFETQSTISLPENLRPIGTDEHCDIERNEKILYQDDLHQIPDNLRDYHSPCCCIKYISFCHTRREANK